MKQEGLRFNENKLRYDLMHPVAQEGLVKVLTKGSLKYSPKNWQYGMAWSKVIASLKRHLSAIENGEDFDLETGELHIDHLQCNAHFLSAYYKIYPQGDDRDQWYKKPFKKLWLDLDGVCVEFEKHFLEFFNLPTYEVIDWGDYRFVDNMEKVKDNDDFWLNCPPLFNPKDLKYPVEGYCTARNCSNEVIDKWLEKNNFPKAKIINVGLGGNKVDALKDKCDVMFDDSIKNFVDFQSNGIVCYLMTRGHNEKYDVGHWRCNDINEFINKVL